MVPRDKIKKRNKAKNAIKKETYSPI